MSKGPITMMVLPLDNSRSLLVLAAPAPQFKDKAAGVAATDRDTGAPLMEVALTVDGGTPQVLRVSVPAPGVPKDLAIGNLVKATGLTLVAGEKNGRAWNLLRANALTAVKP